MSTLIVDQVENKAGNLITVPIGGIIMWSGSIANINNLPGWKLCDGTNGTPDLRNRFVVGASVAIGNYTWNAADGSINGNYAPGNSGGEAAHKLTITELASHTHSKGFQGGDSNGIRGGNSSAVCQQVETESAGGDNYHENRPPYYALAFIMRTA
jgi:microcystin-dependent protein